MANHNERYDTIVTKLRANDYKLTPQRLAVARILARSKGHPSVEQMYAQLQKDFPTISLATIYRNVMLIKTLGEVFELGFADGSNRYDGNKPYPHPHVICTRCKQVIDPDLAAFKDMATAIEKETGFKILTHRLDFFGICRDCAQKT